MPHRRGHHIVFTQDRGEPTPFLLSQLSRSERELVARMPTEQQRRHSALARMAGRSAIAQALKPRHRTDIEIVSDTHGAPIALINKRRGAISVSLAHSSQLAVAVAWRNQPNANYALGVDLERIRDADIADSAFAFSRREIKLIKNAQQGAVPMGLAAWVAKESAWKAMRPAPDFGPDCVQVQMLDLEKGLAMLTASGKLARRFGGVPIVAYLKTIEEPDGAYLAAIAELLTN